MSTTISMDSNKAWHSFEKKRLEVKDRRDKLAAERKKYYDAETAPRKFLWLWTYTPKMDSWDGWYMHTGWELSSLDECLKNIARLQSMCQNSHSITLDKKDFGLIKTA